MSDVPGPGRAVPLVAERVTKRYAERTVVDAVDLRLEPGAVTGLLGPNGAGKTTLLRVLVGLIRPDGGRVLMSGLSPEVPEARRGLGYLPADPVFDRHLSGRDNLDLLADLHGPHGAVDRDPVLDRLRLTTHELERPVRDLSSGMTQKLGIVAALQHRPTLVLLDEPANRLDPLVHRDFCALLREMAGEGRTVLLSSHVLGEVQAVCDRAVLLAAGRLLQVIDVQDLRRHSLREVRLTYLHPHEPPPELVEAHGVGRTVTGRLPAARPDLVRRLLEDPDVEDIELVPPSLDDLFVGLYEKERARDLPAHR